MPWTFSHPAAVLPLRPLCPKYLSLPALMAGSIAPDATYYIDRFDIGSFAHTPAGSVVVCVPAGLLLLLAFLLLRRPLWFLLPDPHRSALAPLVAQRPAMDARVLVAVVVSIVLGAWTHLIWDSFTHEGTWVVSRVALLREPWLRLGAVEFPGYSVLQHLSTLVGAAALAVVYFTWLSKQPRAPVVSTGSDRWRYVALSSAVLVSLGVAIPLALDAAAVHTHQVAMSVFVVRTAVYAVSAFGLLLAAYSASYFALRKKG